MRPLTVQFFKNPDILHWGFEVQYLGEDQWGHWAYAPAGTKRWKGEERVRPSQQPAVFCAPRDGWWHLHYGGSSADTYSLFVDIATPPHWVSDQRYEMIDLDLDVAMRHDGSVVIEDEDEFEAHQVKYQYTAEMIERAVEETHRIDQSLKERQEPFFEVAEAWLRQVEPG